MAIRRRAHVDRVNSFILVWNGDEREQIGFDGEVFYIPPSGVVAKVEPGSPYKFESARDRSGDMIPGTIRVSDRTAVIDGNKVKAFDADQFVKWLEVVRGDLLDRGLFIVDLPEEIEQAKAEGRPVWEASQDNRARMILEAELFRRRRWEDKGQQAPASSSEHLVAWAVKHVNERGTALSGIPTDDIRTALGKGSALPGRVTPFSRMSSVAPPPAAPARAGMPGGPEVYARAKTLGVKLLKDELEGLLSDDAEVVSIVQAKVAEAELKIRELTEAEETPA
jgi:hypothetical protein